MDRIPLAPRFEVIPDEALAYVRDVIARRGMVRAVQILRISRPALLGVLARGAALPGTAALLREAIRRRGEAA